LTSLQRRLKRLEVNLNDPSGLVPDSQQWLEYWLRQVYNRCLTDQEQGEPDRITVFREVMERANKRASLAGGTPVGRRDASDRQMNAAQKPESARGPLRTETRQTQP
jgi:hypothetical protein